ncbi:MAG TPA: hypothetical protein VGO00_28490 [Kofleriaceae bacterium]|jgi:hypothetical protein|nr:hypothetical protein [Kofleriaceae bacterium]
MSYDPRRAKLAIVDPHPLDLPIDIAKVVVVLGTMAVGIVLRARAMPQMMAGAAFMFISILLLVIWGKGLDRRRARRDRALRQRLGDRPYPIYGYVDWLVADEPTTMIKLKEPLVDRAIIPAATWPDELTAMVAIPPTTLGDGLAGGDTAGLAALLDRLAPVADRIARVELTD